MTDNCLKSDLRQFLDEAVLVILTTEVIALMLRKSL